MVRPVTSCCWMQTDSAGNLGHRVSGNGTIHPGLNWDSIRVWCLFRSRWTCRLGIGRDWSCHPSSTGCFGPESVRSRCLSRTRMVRLMQWKIVSDPLSLHPIWMGHSHCCYSDCDSHSGLRWRTAAMGYCLWVRYCPARRTCFAGRGFLAVYRCLEGRCYRDSIAISRFHL